MKAIPRQNAPGGDHLLLIRFSAMGDVAMLAPVVRIATQMHPHLNITILTRGYFAPVFKGIPRVTVYPSDLKGRHKGITGLYKLSREIINLGITAVGDMHNVLRSNIIKILLLNSGIKFRQIDKGRAEKKALIASKNKVFRPLKSTLQRYADVMRDLGYPVDLRKAVFSGKYDLSPKIEKVTGKKDLTWIGVAPFAAHKGKEYPLDLMTEVLKALSRQDQHRIFLFGGGAEEAKKLDTLSAGCDKITSLAGKLKFEEELHVISNLDLMISMDSGNAHLAAMYGIKVLTIWGVTHPFAGFGAINQPEDHHLLPDLKKYPAIPTSVYGNKYPEGYENVMKSISPQRVVERAKKILSKSS